MADSAHTMNLSRRRALLGVSTGVAAASTLGVAAGVAFASPPENSVMDAELIELCWRWCRLDRVWLHTEQKAADADEAGEHELYERLCEISDQIYDNVIVMAQQIAGIPAHSWAGIAAKAACVARAIDQVAEALEEGHCVLVIVPGMMDDILRLTGGDVPARPTRLSGEA
jgi:hypothetical protein